MFSLEPGWEWIETLNEAVIRVGMQQLTGIVSKILQLSVFCFIELS